MRTFVLTAALVGVLCSVNTASCIPSDEAEDVSESAGQRLAITDLAYAGAFRLPEYQDAVSRLGWSNGKLALGMDGDSLLIEGHVDDGAIAEFPIVEPSKAETISALPVTGPPLQPFVSILNRSGIDNPQGLDRIGGLLIVDDALIVNAYEYYDAPADNTHTTMSLSDASDLASSSVIGWSAMGGAARAAGWLSPVPTEWQRELGSTHLSGSSSGMPIVGRASVGPSAFAVNLESSLSSIDVAQPLLDFPLEDSLASDLANESRTNDLWTFLSNAVYGFVVPGTSTYVTLGRSGGHQSGVSYGEGPNGKGYFPSEYGDLTPYYWLWDVNDLAAVRDGELQSFEVRPYDYGPLDVPFADFDASRWNDVGGAAFDTASSRLYLSLSHADREHNEYEPAPLILVFDVQA